MGKKPGAFPVAQTPAVCHRRLGDFIVTTLSDGYLDNVIDSFVGAPAEWIRQSVQERLGHQILRTDVNVFLIRSPDRLILVDAGTGGTMDPTAGSLPACMAAAGIAAGDIDAILITHAHADHLNGLTGRDGRPLFPNAEIVLHEDELSYWNDDAMMAAAPRSETRFFEAVRFQLAPYGGRVRTFREGRIFPGIEGIPCPGHTRGHAAYLVSSRGERLLLWGDLVHAEEFQIERPGIATIWDYDQAMAVDSRRALFEWAARDNLTISGAHLHYPGFSRLVNEDGRYRLLIEPRAYVV